ncbi:MAG: ABC transporter permease [Planctomycetes bacterium]|nr:ABC transporter permease [Planctomycetota bacterium]
MTTEHPVPDDSSDEREPKAKMPPDAFFADARHPDAVPTRPPTQRREVAAVLETDYWSVVLRQLRKNKIGLVGLGIIFFLYLVAVLAPFLAESIPLMVSHENSSDDPCRTCVALGESRDLLKLRDGAALEGKLIRELRAGLYFKVGLQEERYSDDEIESRDFSATPHVLVLKESPIVRKGTTVKGTYLRDAPAVIEFSVPGEEGPRRIPADQKLALESLPRRHGTIRYWPLLRGLDRIDWILVLSLAVVLAGTPVFRRYRKRGLPRGAAYQKTLLVLLAPLLLSAAFIGLRKNERQRFNLVDYPALEGRMEGGRMLWPLVRYSSTTIDKKVMESQPPSWLSVAWDDMGRKKAGEIDPAEWRDNAKRHPLGTDSHRRDVLAMLIHGTRISLSVGFVAVGIYVTIGILIGAVAGFFGGWTDDVIMRIIEIVICFPTFFLIITIIAIAPPSIFMVMAAIALVQWTTVARLVRAEFLRLRKNDFVASARALGASRPRIIFRHILPNALSPVLVSATFGIAGAILTESALSFLGLGVPVDVATWGNMLRLGRDGLPGTWWLALIPGVAIFVTVTSYNLFGEALRDALDPRLKGTT